MSEIFITESEFRSRYQYKPGDLLGEGGFAQVYKAYDKQFEEYVALKFYNKGEQGKYDVLHEMKDSRKFAHPNIIRVHDAFIVRFDHTGGHSFVQVGVLEFANGGNLRDFINSSPTEEQFVNVLKGILSALDYLHRDKKIIHRDLSPENILMYVEGNNWIPKIADFGISKKIDYLSDTKVQKKSTQLLGKVDYMAPEQFYPDKYGINREINTNVDLWAFGVILYELFTHRKPFGQDAQDNPMRIIQSIENDSISDLEEIPEPYRTVIKRCLEKDANIRTKSAKELIALLEQSAPEPEITSADTVPIKEITQRKKVNYMLYTIIFGVLVLLIGGYLIFKPEKNQVEIPETPSLDKEAIQTEIKSLIQENNYNLALIRINQLPEDLKSQQEFVDLYRESIKIKKLDSLQIIGNKLFNSNKYKEARTIYSKIINEYNSSDNKALYRLKIIQEKLDSINKPKYKLYTKFNPSSKPDRTVIDLVSIKITDNNTIVSLKIFASDETFTIYPPGSKGAFFIDYFDKYNNRHRLPLKSIKGIKTGDINGLRNNTMMELYFAKLPSDAKYINLIEGTERLNDQMQYWNFFDIILE